MKFIEFNYREDFGKEWYTSIISIKNISLLQISLDYSDYGGWPYVQITSGMGKFFGILATVGRFGFCLEILSRRWKLCYSEMTLEDYQGDLQDGD